LSAACRRNIITRNSPSSRATITVPASVTPFGGISGDAERNFDDTELDSRGGRQHLGQLQVGSPIVNNFC
jgi:hypothetical protein